MSGDFILEVKADLVQLQGFLSSFTVDLEHSEVCSTDLEGSVREIGLDWQYFMLKLQVLDHLDDDITRIVSTGVFPYP